MERFHESGELNNTHALRNWQDLPRTGPALDANFLEWLVKERRDRAEYLSSHYSAFQVTRYVLITQHDHVNSCCVDFGLIEIQQAVNK